MGSGCFGGKMGLKWAKVRKPERGYCTFFGLPDELLIFFCSSVFFCFSRWQGYWLLGFVANLQQEFRR